MKGHLCKRSGPAPRITGTYLFVDEPKKFARFGHDRKSGVNLDIPFNGFRFYYWTPSNTRSDRIFSNGFLTNECRVYLLGTFWMSTIAKHKSRPEFGRCVSVEDT